MKDIILVHNVSNVTNIRHRIMKLNALKEEQEMMMKRTLKEIYYSLQPSAIIRKAVRDLREDEGVKGSVLQTTLGMGAGFFLDKLLLFRKGAGIKRYLINAGLKKVFSYFIAGNKINMFQKENLNMIFVILGASQPFDPGKR